MLPRIKFQTVKDLDCSNFRQTRKSARFPCSSQHDFVARQTFINMTHPAQLAVEELLADCEFRRTRRSGPGGQHRNKVETAVVVEHRPTGVRAEANERRSQEQNRQVAIHRLRVKLAIELRCPVETAASPLWQARTAGGKLSVNAEHDDFPALLAEALDVIAEANFDLATAASPLGVSSSQLVKFLKIEPESLVIVNRERRSQGQSPYR
jgi:hypothetical protein